LSGCKKNILIIEDDEGIQNLLRIYLNNEGFRVIICSNGERGLKSLKKELPDLIILDLMLPGIDGQTICKKIREISRIPVIMLTAKNDLDDRVRGLNVGADDYITKPFEPRELVARIHAILRRDKRGRDLTPSVLHFSNLQINSNERKVIHEKQEVKLTTKEFDLLWLLASNPDYVFTRNQLLDEIWGEDFFGNVRTVDVHIRRLRQKLEVDPDRPKWLLTVWGVGYKFQEADEK